MPSSNAAQSIKDKPEQVIITIVAAILLFEVQFKNMSVKICVVTVIFMCEVYIYWIRNV